MSTNDYEFDPSQPVEEQAARMVVAETDGLAKRVMSLGGRSYGLNHLTPDQELWAAMFEDTTVDVDALRAQGMSDAEIVDRRHPLVPRLRDQAGRSFEEQARYMARLTDRVIKARAEGRTPKPPTRPEGV